MQEVVATTFVNEAQSKIVSAVIFSGAGTSARFPYALRWTMRPLCPTMSTAPGSFFCVIARSIAASRSAEAEKV